MFVDFGGRVREQGEKMRITKAKWDTVTHIKQCVTKWEKSVIPKKISLISHLSKSWTGSSQLTNTTLSSPSILSVFLIRYCDGRALEQAGGPMAWWWQPSGELRCWSKISIRKFLLSFSWGALIGGSSPLLDHHPQAITCSVLFGFDLRRWPIISRTPPHYPFSVSAVRMKNWYSHLIDRVEKSNDSCIPPDPYPIRRTEGSNIQIRTSKFELQGHVGHSRRISEKK